MPRAGRASPHPVLCPAAVPRLPVSGRELRAGHPARPAGCSYVVLCRHGPGASSLLAAATATFPVVSVWHWHRHRLALPCPFSGTETRVLVLCSNSKAIALEECRITRNSTQRMRSEAPGSAHREVRLGPRLLPRGWMRRELSGRKAARPALLLASSARRRSEQLPLGLSRCDAACGLRGDAGRWRSAWCGEAAGTHGAVLRSCAERRSPQLLRRCSERRMLLGRAMSALRRVSGKTFSGRRSCCGYRPGPRDEPGRRRRRGCAGMAGAAVVRAGPAGAAGTWGWLVTQSCLPAGTAGPGAAPPALVLLVTTGRFLPGCISVCSKVRWLCL